MLQVISLKIKNFLSVADAELKPGQINQIVGMNNQGKTTVLKALAFAKGGANDGTLVKHGEDSAEVIVELSDKTLIRRRLKADGTQSVDVKNGEGFKRPRPQEFLDDLFDQSSFNPLDLLDPKKRNDAILASIELKLTPEILAKELGVEVKDLPPLNFGDHGLTVIEKAHEYFYKRRAEANKDASEKKKRFDTYKADLPAMPTAGSVDAAKVQLAIQDEQKGLGAIQERIILADREIESAKKSEQKVFRYESELAAIDKQISAEDVNFQSGLEELGAMARARMEELERYRVSEMNRIANATIAEKSRLESEHAAFVAEHEKNRAALKARQESGNKHLEEARKEVPATVPDKSQLEATAANHRTLIANHQRTLAEIEQANGVKKQHAMVEGYKADWDKAQTFAGHLTAQVDLLAGEIRARLMSTVEMPVVGLEYKGGEFLVDGVPVDNLSSSKALKLAIGVARKLAKKTRLICIDGAELLDQESFDAICAETKDDGYVYFLTKVGEPFEGEGSKVFNASGGKITEKTA